MYFVLLSFFAPADRCRIHDIQLHIFEAEKGRRMTMTAAMMSNREKKQNLFLLLRIFTWRGWCWLSTTLRSNGNNINVKYKKYKSNWLQLYFEHGLECVRCNEPVYSFNEQETQQFFFATLAFFRSPSSSSSSLRHIRSVQFFIH